MSQQQDIQAIAVNDAPYGRRVYLAAVIVGVLTGCCAWVLKGMVMLVSELCTRHFDAVGGNLFLLAVPVAGIVLTGTLVRYLFRTPLEQATERMKGLITAHNPYIKPVIMIAPMIASSITLGFGGSAGSEGPIAYTGGALGSNIGRWLGIKGDDLMVLMACGAGAGIAAIFKSPVGGMFFTVEVLAMPLRTRSVVVLAIMCIVSGLTAYSLSGFTPNMYAAGLGHTSGKVVLTAVALGAVCGLYSVYYNTTGLATRRMLHRIGSPWVRNIVSGVILAGALYCFPALYGEGYTLMSTVVCGNSRAVLSGIPFGSGCTLGLALGGILLLKGIACYATNSGGGVAGDFAPTLFAGCMTGCLAALAGQALGLTGVETGTCAFLGMAGVMAGTTGAPLMAIFLVVEMTQCPGLLLPVAVTASVSYGISRMFARKRSI